MTSVFDLPGRLAAKGDPALIADDEAHFARMSRALDRQVDELEFQLVAARRAPAGFGQQAMDRDREVHRLSARLRMLRRFSLDLCLGRVVTEEGRTVYLGRLGLTDAADERLLVDWRSPAAEPFFAATHRDPHGLVSRRRYRWRDGRITDYWDEVFTEAGLLSVATLDDESAFIASLSASRSPRMRDVLGTIAADQDAIIRASSRGALVVDGGPGTGKTVVALHRAAYLSYSDPRLGERRGGVLVVGPHQPYLSYVEDVLPSLGEEDVRTCTLRELVPGVDPLLGESDPVAARLKSDARMVGAIEPAVGLYEEVPREAMELATPSGTVWVRPSDWAEAIASVDPGTPHNDAREVVWSALVAILAERVRGGARGGDAGGDPDGLVVEEEFDAYGVRPDEEDDREGRELESCPDLVEAVGRVWPRLDPEDVVADLWEVPAYLRRCAPWLGDDEVRALRRAEPRAWTVEDLPILDAARRRLGDPEESRRRERQRAQTRAELRDRAEVTAHLIASDDSDLKIMSMLRGQDLRMALREEPGPVSDPDPLAGPFAHVVVDEAQELTDAEWQMLLARCPSQSMTIVGDRAQARRGFTEPWAERLRRVGVHQIAVSSLSINYRTPSEVMAEAEPVIRAAIPDANVPVSIRSSGSPVLHASVHELDRIVDRWLASHDDGIACVISADLEAEEPHQRVRRLRPEHAKGLEFDLVVLVDPGGLGGGITGAVDRYVAMTRATHQLAILSPEPRTGAGD